MASGVALGGLGERVRRGLRALDRRLPARLSDATHELAGRTRLRLGRDPFAVPSGHEAFVAEVIPALGVGTDEALTYVEFGVFEGASLAAAVRGADRAGRGHGARFFGLDSFDGLPPGSDAEGWIAGSFRSPRARTEWNLRRLGVAGRVELVEGWFDDTCTPELAARIGRIHVVMLDCDTYASSATALAFVEPLLADPCAIVLDDYGTWDPAATPTAGQPKAFAEFVERHPGLVVEDRGPLGHHGRGVVVRNL